MHFTSIGFWRTNFQLPTIQNRNMLQNYTILKYYEHNRVRRVKGWKLPKQMLTSFFTLIFACIIDSFTLLASIHNCTSRILSISSVTIIDADLEVITSFILLATCIVRGRSNRSLKSYLTLDRELKGMQNKICTQRKTSNVNIID